MCVLYAYHLRQEAVSRSVVVVAVAVVVGCVGDVDVVWRTSLSRVWTCSEMASRYSVARVSSPAPAVVTDGTAQVLVSCIPEESYIARLGPVISTPSKLGLIL